MRVTTNGFFSSSLLCVLAVATSLAVASCEFGNVDAPLGNTAREGGAGGTAGTGGPAGSTGVTAGGTGGAAGSTGGAAGSTGGAAGSTGGATGGTAGGAVCFSPTQNLDTAYEGGVGCACAPDAHARCIGSVALVCTDGVWQAVEDGPCMPSTCTEPLDIFEWCDIADWVGFWHNAETGQCEPFLGGCPMNANAFDSFEACAESCQDMLTTTAVVPWGGCYELGEPVAGVGDTVPYDRIGDVLEIPLEWGCGCPTRPEFTIAYGAASPLRLWLCHDEMADSCEAACSETLTFDLGQALQAAGATEIVFVE